MEQPVDIAVCAHVSCWAILRYYSEKFAHYREYLIYDVAKLVSPFDPGGLVPSLGLTIIDAERVFQAAGCYPLLIVKKPTGSNYDSAHDDEEDVAFYQEMLAYLESGFPLFVEMRRQLHAVVVVGCKWREVSIEPAQGVTHAWDQVDSLLMVDDNLLPYRSISTDRGTSVASTLDYTGRDFTKFIVALPEKIHFPATAIDVLCDSLANALVSGFRVDEACTRIRRYFMATVSELRTKVREHASQLGNELVDLFMCLESAQYVWLVEFCNQEQWDRGNIAACAIVDATASQHDPLPTLLLYDERLAISFDRTSGCAMHRHVELARPVNIPLPRMEFNLQQVVRYDVD